MERAEPTVVVPDTQPSPVDAPVHPVTMADLPVTMIELLPFESVPEAQPVFEAPPQPEEKWVVTLLEPTSSRRLAESLLIFISAILFLRAMAVEPFGVPTGSMAPTLSGNHRRAICPRCGYSIRVGEPRERDGRRMPYPKVACPMCGKPDIDMKLEIDIAGDRLLVDKNVYSLRKPRRWEPAVFRCPSDLSKPYVKRVIALPGERVFVFDGDIYINDHLARKTLRECRESRIPIFDINFPPQPDGWLKSFLVENKTPIPENSQSTGPLFALGERELRLDGSAAEDAPVWVMYRHNRFDEAAGFDKEDVIRDSFVYNGPVGEDRTQPVHDFMVEFEVEILSGSGSLQCRLWDGRDQIVASCPVGSDGETQIHQDGFGTVRSAPRKALRPGKKYRVEMAFVDRRISFAIDGKEPMLAYDLDPAKTRADVISPAAIGVQGISVVVRDMKVYRDIYYRSSGRNAVEEAYQLGPDEYFMMGDNSANSDDSRSWPIPGVPERNYLGKPFLLHQPSRISHMAIGGNERAFHSIDWGRIRFLR